MLRGAIAETKATDLPIPVWREGLHRLRKKVNAADFGEVCLDDVGASNVKATRGCIKIFCRSSGGRTWLPVRELGWDPQCD